ncbi:hypothetical protein GGR56DRAFT_668452 [Xylariaceae sp. FL0804]|nr:hypothetical protein GGR56DRAFT_668452 [Xylariaceae sp. FL0804]
MAMPEQPQLHVAIMGRGIIGLITAMGLLKRQIPVKIYKQSRSFREIGAGVAFTANAMTCIKHLDPAIVDAVNAVTTPNGENTGEPNDYVRFHDGYHWDPQDPEGTDDKLLGLLHTGYKGFQGCNRAHLLDELVKHIPEHAVEFRKRLDGSTIEADLIIGCNGNKSKVRELILGADNPCARVHFSHKVAFRALVPMARAEPALGSFKAHNQHMHVGPSAHLLHFPVSGHSMLNIVAFTAEPGNWPLRDGDGDGGSANGDNGPRRNNMTAPATRAEVSAAFEGWGPTVRRLVNLLPDQMDKWAIFDAYDHPAPRYARGRVCIAGNAAHASAPHHGAGAGIGVEDALALCTLLEMVAAAAQQGGGGGGAATALVDRALAAYSESSREAKCMEEITTRSHKLWYFDIEGMLDAVRDRFEAEAKF